MVEGGIRGRPKVMGRNVMGIEGREIRESKAMGGLEVRTRNVCWRQERSSR